MIQRETITLWDRPDEADPSHHRNRSDRAADRLVRGAAEALEDPIRFMAYGIRYATHDDMTVLRRIVSDDDFREALDRAPSGIVDARSWAYWNSMMGRYPTPPLPKRSFD